MMAGFEGVDWHRGLDWAALRAYRLQRLSSAMQQQGLDAVLLSRLDTIRYATSFRPIYSMWFYSTRYIAIVTARGHVAFLVASGDYLRVKETMPWLEDVTPFPFSMLDGVPIIAQALERLDLGKARVGVDMIPTGVLLALQERLPQLRLADAMPAVESARRIKHPVEIELLRQAARLADVGMQAALEHLREGVAEMEVSARAAHAMMLAGSEDVPYYPLVISGPRTWLKFRFPTAAAVRTGDMVWLDCGACIYQGYNGDIARMAVVGGRPSAEQRRIYRTVYEMLQTVLRLARPGVETAELAAAAMEVARQAGYEAYTAPVILGHGVGTDLHETPVIGEKVAGARRQSERLEANMVLSAEPGIIVPGVGGGHLEDMFVVTDDGAEVLTRTPFDEAMLA